MSQSRVALLSVYDKSGIQDLAKNLHSNGYTLLSSGGTAEALRDAGLPVTEISEYTNSPEVLGGRVKTLHPRVHAGILARPGLPSDQDDLSKLGAQNIEVVVVNLYPFEKTVSAAYVTEDQAIENIDIGGHTLIRAAAKNYQHVWVVTDPKDYSDLWRDLREPCDDPVRLRRKYAVKAFHHVANYDNLIHSYMFSIG